MSHEPRDERDETGRVCQFVPVMVGRKGREPYWARPFVPDPLPEDRHGGGRTPPSCLTWCSSPAALACSYSTAINSSRPFAVAIPTCPRLRRTLPRHRERPPNLSMPTSFNPSRAFLRRGGWRRPASIACRTSASAGACDSTLPKCSRAMPSAAGRFQTADWRVVLLVRLTGARQKSNKEQIDARPVSRLVSRPSGGICH